MADDLLAIEEGWGSTLSLLSAGSSSSSCSSSSSSSSASWSDHHHSTSCGKVANAAPHHEYFNGLAMFSPAIDDASRPVVHAVPSDGSPTLPCSDSHQQQLLADLMLAPSASDDMASPYDECLSLSQSPSLDLFSSPSMCSSPTASSSAPASPSWSPVCTVPSSLPCLSLPTPPVPLAAGVAVKPEVAARVAPVAMAIVQTKAALAAAAAAAADEPPKKRRRKRKRSDIDLPPTAVTLSRSELLKMTTEDLDRYEEHVRQTRELTSEEIQDIKRQRRLIKNRESAQQSRMRKKAQSDVIDTTLTDLAKENIALTERLQQVEAENQELRRENDALRQELKRASGSRSSAAAASASDEWSIASWFSIGGGGPSSPLPAKINGGGVYLMIVLLSVAFMFNIKSGVPTRLTSIPTVSTAAGRVFGDQDEVPPSSSFGTTIGAPRSPRQQLPPSGSSARMRMQSSSRGAPAPASAAATAAVPKAPGAQIGSQPGIRKLLEHQTLREYSHLKIEGMTDATAASSLKNNADTNSTADYNGDLEQGSSYSFGSDTAVSAPSAPISTGSGWSLLPRAVRREAVLLMHGQHVEQQQARWRNLSSWFSGGYNNDAATSTGPIDG